MREREPLDPRWILTPQAGRIAAHIYHAMTGEHATARLHGWVAAAQGDTPTLADVWAQHGDALIADAAAHGFQPFAATRKQPTGAGFDQWRADFLKQHTY